MIEIANYDKYEIRAHEAFIRRASIVDFPFVLKGSYVTRQYFKDPSHRIPGDVDWVALHKIDNEEEARTIFTKWATEVTELELDDDVKFLSFTQNEFWRRIDYAMSDDFPTVNTDISCNVSGMEVEFGLDISFNLDIDYPLIPLEYKPIMGDTFTVPNTVPLNLQVAWKVHQTLVRPRFKDIFDLMHLVQHPSFDKKTMTQAYEALLQECRADLVDWNKLKYFLEYKIDKLFNNNTMQETWDFWRHDINKKAYRGNIHYADRGYWVTDLNLLTEDMNDFMGHFQTVMTQSGWTREAISELNISDADKSILDYLDEEDKPSFWDRVKRILE